MFLGRAFLPCLASAAKCTKFACETSVMRIALNKNVTSMWLSPYGSAMLKHEFVDMHQFSAKVKRKLWTSGIKRPKGKWARALSRLACHMALCSSSFNGWAPPVQHEQGSTNSQSNSCNTRTCEHSNLRFIQTKRTHSLQHQRCLCCTGKG